MTAKEAIEIVEKATHGNADCQVAIQVIRREIEDWRNECEKKSRLASQPEQIGWRFGPSQPMLACRSYYTNFCLCF